MRCRACGSEQIGRLVEDYHFTSSGLDYVFLQGIDYWRCECGEETVRIPRMKQLLEGIGEVIVTRKPHLEAQDIVFIRKGMGIKAKEMAEILGVDPSGYSRWENGKVSPGTANERLIRIVYAVDKNLESIEDLTRFFPEQDEEEVRQNLRTILSDDKMEYEFFEAVV